MRISGWLLGTIGFFSLIVMTGICAVVSFGLTRTTVIDLWDSGIQVESPFEVAQAVMNPQLVAVEASATPLNNGIVLIPSATPLATAVVNSAQSPTQQVLSIEAPQNDAEDTSDALATNGAEAAEFAWRDPRQVRVLLMGIDQRTGFTDDEPAFRTDTMILINLDPVRNTAGVISFPRDLWVDIPNFEPARMNTANFQGDINAYPGGGGPALAMETINANFGIPVDYYVMVNFNVFETVVDILAPEGVPIEVREVIRDPDYPDEGFGTINVEFDPGVENMNGQRLLQYARTRATQGSDFDRARRQQQVLEALRRELLSAGGVSNFITQIGRLWQELSGSYRTNLTLDQIIGLGLEISEIERENINYLVIGTDYVNLGKSPEGDDVLYPVYARINDAVQRIFYPEIDVTTADLRARADLENAPVRIFNGTDIARLASRTQEWLIGQGVRIQAIGDAPFDVTQTVIRNYSGGRDTALWLADLLGLPPERIQPGTDGLVATGVAIITGDDMEAIISGP